MDVGRMIPSYQLLDRKNPVFSSFIVWSSVLIIKHLLMSTLTSIQRFKNKTFANPEDLVLGGAGASETKFGNEDVERVRRAHRNDMENILPYLSAGLFYVFTDPGVMLATILFKIATVARIVHTIVYAIFVVPQPARALAFGIHFTITLYMAFASIFYFF